MALNLIDNWQMARILTDNWHLYPPTPKPDPPKIALHYKSIFVII